MTSSIPAAGPDLQRLFDIFPCTVATPSWELVHAEEVPEPYRSLLVHEHHMTVTVEAFHGDTVDVRILARRHQGDMYARKILLVLRGSGRVVQFGIVRVDLSIVAEPVRADIVAGEKPFGRVLIEHDVLRRIEPTAYLRLTPTPLWQAWFGLNETRTLYGRLALIHCDDRPAVELLEVVAPEA
jgi:chorismate-pyruvate lyase